MTRAMVALILAYARPPLTPPPWPGVADHTRRRTPA
jgi:hypothetical protein